ncbi:MAG: DUF6155 family protein [Bacteroides sp.]|nr:DUF6155 family protein [Bacteroides sp.]MCM1389557.1 DUF6155 family protein [Bacteroides sp.]
MSKTTLKKQIKELTKEQLIEVMLELYDARKEAREYLEYYVNPDENKMFEKYNAIIHKEFFPQKGRAKGRTSVCKKAIKDFISLHPSPKLIAELKFSTVETIVKYAVNSRFWLRESQENTLLAFFKESLDYMFSNDLLDYFNRRIDDVLKRCNTSRCQFRDEIFRIKAEFDESLK